MNKIILGAIIIISAALAGCDPGIYGDGGKVEAAIVNETDLEVSVFRLKKDEERELLGKVLAFHTRTFEISSGQCLEFEGNGSMHIVWGFTECFANSGSVVLNY